MTGEGENGAAAGADRKPVARSVLDISGVLATQVAAAGHEAYSRSVEFRLALAPEGDLARAQTQRNDGGASRLPPVKPAICGSLGRDG